jgi:hypothetical protein
MFMPTLLTAIPPSSTSIVGGDVGATDGNALRVSSTLALRTPVAPPNLLSEQAVFPSSKTNAKMDCFLDMREVSVKNFET